MSNSLNEAIFSDEELEKLHTKCSLDISQSMNISNVFNEIMNLEFEKFKQINEATQISLTTYNSLVANALNDAIFSDEELEKLHTKCSLYVSKSLNISRTFNETMNLEFEKFKQINEAMQTSLTTYNSLMINALNSGIFSDEEFEILHQTCASESLKSFNTALLNAKYLVVNFSGKINKIIKPEFEKFKQINEFNNKFYGKDPFPYRETPYYSKISNIIVCFVIVIIIIIIIIIKLKDPENDILIYAILLFAPLYYTIQRNMQRPIR
jgi:hypothetical protein